MQNIIYANRVDGLGSRLNTIINGFYLAEILDYPENIKFSWTDSTFYGHNNYLLNYEISGNEREIDGYKIIGASVEKKENIFREEFIKKYFMKSYQDGDIIEFPNNSFIDNLKNIFLKNSMLSPCMKLNHIIKDLDYKNYRERAEYIFFNKIGFSSNIKQIFLEGKSRLSEIFDGYIVIHIRSGDAIYGYSKFRTFGSLNTYQTITYELVLYILNLEEKENIILVGDDVSTIDQFIKIINKPNVISINSLRNIDQYSNLELTFFDVGVMSSAKKIYGSYASLVTLATLSNSQVEFINPFENLLENTVYNILKTNYKKNYFLNNYYKAHSLFLRYLYGLKIEIDVKELICLLRKALVCDRSNDKYRIYLIMHFIKLGDFEKAERYLSLILYSRHDEFIKVFFIKFPYFIFNDVFNVFKNLNLNNEMPYLNIQYIISRIYFVIGEIENAIRIAKDIKCYKSYNYVIDYYIQLFDYCLYNKYKEQYIHNLEQNIENLNYQIQFKTAKARIQNHLSYKLGQVLIENSKSIFGYIRMPFVLSYIKDKHKLEQKAYEEKIKENPNLALPPLETYPDYKEALKEKECLTYKLGQAFIKSSKTWYKGGYVKFIFEIRKLKKVSK